MKNLTLVAFTPMIVFASNAAADNYSTSHIRALSPGIEQYSSSLPTDQFERLLCEVDEEFISIRGNNNMLLVDLFDENGVWVSQVNVLDPDGIKSVKYHGAKIFQDNIYVFFSGRSETTAKGHYGLYAWKYSNEIGDFKEPKLLDEFPLTANINRFFVDVSPNGKYIGFVIEPKTYCKIYKHSAAVFTDNFEKIFTDNCRDQEFETCQMFSSAEMGDDGKLTLIYTEKYETYMNIGFQEASKTVAYITYNLSPERKVTYFRDEHRKILHFKMIEDDNEPFFFFSWFYSDTTNHVGFSLMDPETGEENIIHEFDPVFLEPFISAGTFGTMKDETEQKNGQVGAKVNAFIDLIDIIDFEGDTYFLLEKRTPIRFRYGNSSNSASYYMDLEGDLLLIDVTNERQVKIERKVLSFLTPRGVQNNSLDLSLQLYYYSTSSGDAENVSIAFASTPGIIKEQQTSDRHLYRTEIDFETLELTTREVIPTDKESNYIYLSLQRALLFGKSFTTIGWVDKNLYILALDEIESE